MGLWKLICLTNVSLYTTSENLNWYSQRAVSYTHLDVYKRQLQELCKVLVYPCYLNKSKYAIEKYSN